MTWQLWFVVAVLVLECAGPIHRVGRQRSPLTANEATMQLFEMLTLVGLILWGAA